MLSRISFLISSGPFRIVFCVHMHLHGHQLWFDHSTFWHDSELRSESTARSRTYRDLVLDVNISISHVPPLNSSSRYVFRSCSWWRLHFFLILYPWLDLDPCFSITYTRISIANAHTCADHWLIVTQRVLFQSSEVAGRSKTNVSLSHLSSSFDGTMTSWTRFSQDVHSGKPSCSMVSSWFPLFRSSSIPLLKNDVAHVTPTSPAQKCHIRPSLRLSSLEDCLQDTKDLIKNSLDSEEILTSEQTLTDLWSSDHTPDTEVELELSRDKSSWSQSSKNSSIWTFFSMDLSIRKSELVQTSSHSGMTLLLTLSSHTVSLVPTSLQCREIHLKSRWTFTLPMRRWIRSFSLWLPSQAERQTDLFSSYCGFCFQVCLARWISSWDARMIALFPHTLTDADNQRES